MTPREEYEALAATADALNAQGNDLLHRACDIREQAQAAYLKLDEAKDILRSLGWEWQQTYGGLGWRLGAGISRAAFDFFDAAGSGGSRYHCEVALDGGSVNLNDNEVTIGFDNGVQAVAFVKQYGIKADLAPLRKALADKLAAVAEFQDLVTLLDGGQ